MENNIMNSIKYNYIYNNEIFISEESLIKNHYTWSSQYQHVVVSSSEFFCNLIQDGYNILDIGAQSGCFSLAAKFFPNTKWKSFEADPLNYHLLTQNINLNQIKNVDCYNFGISDINQEMDLNVSLNHRGLNTFGVSNLEGLGAIEKVKVKVFKLDDIIDHKVDLIKIDTEGSEFNILVGSKKLILENKPKIFLEYDENHLNKFGKQLKDLNDLIKELNYKIDSHYDGSVLISPK
jgi:FkbM family methyltransferase